ncbi:MAG: hypothetical protein HOO67_01535 [Candidatus Peribacteraceae bacterium]|nr:hypothetical protein [Candidatus Peribacteraceae bacterium]
MIFSLKNLTTLAAEPLNPWEGDWLPKLPPNAVTDKKARGTWMNLPTTEYNAYSGFEGVNAGRRVNGDASEDGNPPRNHHAFAVDYDFPLSDIEVDSAVARMSVKPNWVEKSLSGNWRLVWLFEKPVPMINYAFAVAWLESLDQILPFRQMAGVDESAVKAPERYLTNGGIWRKLHDDPVPFSLLLGHYTEVSRKFNWTDSGLGVTVPLDVAAGKLKELFPRFSEWEGDFVLDSQGPSFWVDGSTSPKSATVRPTGLQTFSAHASKSFYDWSELLGAEFVKQFKKEELGKAVENIFFDGHNYILRNDQSQWLWNTKDDLSLFLRCKRGLTDRRAKGASFTQVESALMLIRDTALVASAGSFAGYKKGLMTNNGNRYLNIHNRDVMQPAAEKVAWGPQGDFPFLSKFLDGFFSSPDQLPFFLAWLARFYKSSFFRDPRSGQAVFIFGNVGLGKSFINTGIISPLLGGHADANKFLLGSDAFNSEMFDYLFWAIDDGTGTTSQMMRERFAELVKMLVANRNFMSNEKFRKAAMVQWQGRISVTGNVDAESLRRLPAMDISMREKVMLFLAAPKRADGFVFEEEKETRALLARELPFFARFLLDYVPEPQCVGEEVRFGVREYHEPSLLMEANLSSTSATFGEILDESLREYFCVRDEEADFWSGTALQLHKMILSDLTLTEAMRGTNVQQVARNLAQLATKGSFKIDVGTDAHRRIYKIYRDDRFPKKPRLAPIPQSAKFAATTTS